MAALSALYVTSHRRPVPCFRCLLVWARALAPCRYVDSCTQLLNVALGSDTGNSTVFSNKRTPAARVPGLLTENWIEPAR